MDSYKYIFLSIFAGFLLIISIISALGASNPVVGTILENGTSETSIDDLISSNNETALSGETSSFNEILPFNETSSSNVTGLISQEIKLNLNFLTSMLQMLNLNLHLINETLNAHLEEFPFLQPTIEGTDEGIKTVDNILVILNMDPNNTSNSNVTLHSLNATMSQINSSLTYPDNMIESANMTMGTPNNTTPVIGDMFTSVKGMVSLLEQF